MMFVSLHHHKDGSTLFNSIYYEVAKKGRA